MFGRRKSKGESGAGEVEAHRQRESDAASRVLNDLKLSQQDIAETYYPIDTDYWKALSGAFGATTGKDSAIAITHSMDRYDSVLNNVLDAEPKGDAAAQAIIKLRRSIKASPTASAYTVKLDLPKTEEARAIRDAVRGMVSDSVNSVAPLYPLDSYRPKDHKDVQISFPAVDAQHRPGTSQKTAGRLPKEGLELVITSANQEALGNFLNELLPQNKRLDRSPVGQPEGWGKYKEVAVDWPQVPKPAESEKPAQTIMGTSITDLNTGPLVLANKPTGRGQGT